jgi:hypothetical protein
MNNAIKSLSIILFIMTFVNFCKAKANQSQNWLDNIKVDVRLNKEVFAFGEPIALQLKAVNLNEEAVQVWENNGFYFILKAKDNDQNQLKDIYPTTLSLKSTPILIPAGAAFNDVTFINKYIRFTGAGEYQVTYDGSLDVNLASEKHDYLSRRQMLISDTVHIKIKPTSENEIEEALKEYLELLKTEDYRLHNQAIRAFSVAQPTVSLKILKEALQAADTDKYIRYAYSATHAIGKIDTAESVELLIDLVKDSENQKIRREAIGAFRSFHANKEIALAVFIDLLSDQDPDIRIAALKGLRFVNQKSSIPQVEQLLNDPDEQVRKEVAKTLQKLIQQDE